MATPCQPSALATLAAVTLCAPRTRPNVSAGVRVSGWQKSSPSARVMRSRSSGGSAGAPVVVPAPGRWARRGLNVAPSKVQRFITRMIRCRRAASTEPNVRSIHGSISAGGSMIPSLTSTWNSRSARARLRVW